MTNRHHETSDIHLPLEQASLLIEGIQEPVADNHDIPCGALSADDWQAYIVHTADAETSMRITEHLLECDACRHACDDALLGQSPDTATSMTSTQLAALMGALRPCHATDPAAPVEKQPPVKGSIKHER